MAPAERLAQRLAVGVPALLLAGAYLSQYGFGLYPCEMCWWQRYPHFAAVALALVSYLAPPPRAWIALAGLAILGSGVIGVFHAGVEYHLWQGITGCARLDVSGADPLDVVLNTPLIRCDQAQWRFLSLIACRVERCGLDHRCHHHFHAPRSQGPRNARCPRTPRMKDRSDMIRVDQAGEFGATRIYAGQLAVMGEREPLSAEIRGMAEQEAAHRAQFDALLARRGVRPTALQPLWNAAGYALGAATALIGPEAAMACTAAVEEEIDRHYSAQLAELEADGDDPELTEMVRAFREDERDHRDAALAAGAERAPAFPLLTGAIRLGCRAAIALSRRI